MLLLHQTYGAETVDSAKRKLISGQLMPSEITNSKKDWKLCFNCKVCNDKGFQRFYIRFVQVRRKLEIKRRIKK